MSVISVPGEQVSLPMTEAVLLPVEEKAALIPTSFVNLQMEKFITVIYQHPTT